ncbi:MAG: M3 family oligoendopeptidase [Proteobacteria bacterium]|nr:M3 family oligoendopeptidase [Pseudomonadota bacterium]
MSFVHHPERPETLTAGFVEAEYAKLIGRCASAEAAEDATPWRSLFADWNALKSYVSSEGSRLRYAYTKDMRDAASEEAERTFREQVVPASEDANAALIEALLASQHRGDLAEHYGEQLVRVLEVNEPTLAPQNSALRVKAGELAKRYDKLVASGEVVIDGETLTLPRVRGLTTSSDAATRRKAFEAYYGWYIDHRDAIAAIYAEQVAVRDEMGRNLGHENHVRLGYAGMGRVDYGPAESKQFRDAVRTYASPLFAKIGADQAKALGADSFRPWDRGFHPDLTLPTGVAEPIDQQLDKAGRVFERLSPKLAAHFENMRAQGLIDLENRKGKAAGAYCTSFPDEAKVAIFCNSIGDQSDVRTLTHEMGHAFQGWESQWIEAIDLRWPSLDAAEVHSMGMEYLTLPYLDEFFTPTQLEQFTRSRWKKAVELLCYVCVVDAFQHWVYENPTATADARDAQWTVFQDEYMPGLDWSGDAARYASSRWYAQLHIFRYPFYYIDYAIAETAAMQLGLLDGQDHEACLETYLELCRLGGTGSVLELLSGAGLRSPFEGELMRDLMAHAASVLGLD